MKLIFLSLLCATVAYGRFGETRCGNDADCSESECCVISRGGAIGGVIGKREEVTQGDTGEVTTGRPVMTTTESAGEDWLGGLLGSALSAFGGGESTTSAPGTNSSSADSTTGPTAPGLSVDDLIQKAIGLLGGGGSGLDVTKLLDAFSGAGNLAALAELNKMGHVNGTGKLLAELTKLEGKGAGWFNEVWGKTPATMRGVCRQMGQSGDRCARHASSQLCPCVQGLTCAIDTKHVFGLGSFGAIKGLHDLKCMEL